MCAQANSKGSLAGADGLTEGGEKDMIKDPKLIKFFDVNVKVEIN